MYQSRRPTKEKKRLYEFMERHKVGGTVSGIKISKYAEKKGFTIRKAQLGKSSFQIVNPTENVLGAGLAKKKRVYWWSIN